MSVLTDSRYFHGSFNYLTELSGSVKLPLLCKDFILSEVQIDNAFAHGADFILLIASILNIRELRILSARAGRYSMKVLYELHDRDEFEKIQDLDPELVGVNSRDLKSFSIDKKRAVETIRSLNGDFLIIAESGIETPERRQEFQTRRSRRLSDRHRAHDRRTTRRTSWQNSTAPWRRHVREGLRYNGQSSR